jgi:hypothetical protein
MEETEDFVAAQKSSEPGQGLLATIRGNLRAVLATMCSTINGTVAFYVVLVNMPTFAHKQLGLPLDQVFMVQMLAVAPDDVVISGMSVTIQI